MYAIRGVQRSKSVIQQHRMTWKSTVGQSSVICDKILGAPHLSSRYLVNYSNSVEPLANTVSAENRKRFFKTARPDESTSFCFTVHRPFNNCQCWHHRPSLGHEVGAILSSYDQLSSIRLRSSVRLLHSSKTVGDKESLKPSSKVEETVIALKEKREEQGAIVAKPVKRTLWKKIVDEILHYYHGFRLLFIDIRIAAGLVNKILNGKSLTRREHKQLIRTTSDVFRLVPFSVFIIVPFMELLLPVFLKFFPGMLPSTFQTQNEKERKMKSELKVKLEMAKFLQQTLDDMAVAGKGRSSQDAKEFAAFMNKMRHTGGEVSNDEIIKFSKLFEDEITLDSLSREQLVALCRVLEISTIGTTALLRFQLRMKLRNLAADDRVIEKEGVDALNDTELQAACKARGMRALGVPEDRLRRQLKSWLELSLHKKVPPSLLLLSRAMYLPENLPTPIQLQASIAALSDAAAIQAKAAIGEREGKIDNKTRIELIKAEQKKIAEEIAEEKMLADSAKKAKEEELVDLAPIIDVNEEPKTSEPATIEKLRPKVHALLGPEILRRGTATTVQETIERRLTKHVPHPLADTQKDPLTAEDLEKIESALDVLGTQKRELYIEKEELEDLKEELADYQEDIKDLGAVAKQTEVQESKAAKQLYKRVNRMIHKMENIVDTLQQQPTQPSQDSKAQGAQVIKPEVKKSQVIAVQELIEAIQKVQNVSDPSRIEKIADVLENMDDDGDGQLEVDAVVKILELIGREHVNLHPNQVSEIVSLLEKEQVVQGKSEKAKAK